MEIQSKRLKIKDQTTNNEREATIGETVHIYELTNKQLQELNTKYQTLQKELHQSQQNMMLVPKNIMN